MFASLHSCCRIACGLLLLAALGCHAPTFGPPMPRLEASHKPDRETAAQTDQQNDNPSAVATPESVAAADSAALASVMAQVQEIGQTNPDAQQALMAELARSKPSMWPLVVEQFRASLAYHNQLSEKSPPPAPPVIPIPTPAAEPPSAEVGRLPDPRSVRPDPAVERLFATATPANMPPPLDAQAAVVAQDVPRAFDDDASATPIQQKTTAAVVDADVHPASLTTSAPPTLAAPLDWQQYLDLAIDDLEDRLADGPQSTAEVHQLVSLRLLRLLAGQTEEALEPIPNISPVEQDFWSGQIFALATYLDHHTQPDDKRRAAASVIHLDEAVGHLRELGSLSLRNLTFCKKVYDYGAYDPLDEARFAPGQQVLLYVEVENYHSESTADGYCTSLGASYELLDENDKRVESGDFPDVEDCCRSRRRDFHIQYGLMLPKSLAPGKYRLDLAMKDRRSDKRGHASINFEIRGN